MRALMVSTEEGLRQVSGSIFVHALTAALILSLPAAFSAIKLKSFYWMLFWIGVMSP